MNRFIPIPYRKTIALQLRDLAGALPDAIAALVMVAAIGCACVALEPSAPVHVARTAATTIR